MKGAHLEHDGRSTAFDFDAIESEQNEITAKELATAMACETLSRVFSWIGRGQIGRETAISSQTLGLRAIAALWVLRPDILGGISQIELSRRLGVTDSILSRYAADFRDVYGFKGRAQRSNETRAKMRTAHRVEGVS